MEYVDRIDSALNIAFDYGQFEGESHLRWCIDRMVRALTQEGYEDWVEEYENDEETGEEYEWDTGIKP